MGTRSVMMLKDKKPMAHLAVRGVAKEVEGWRRPMISPLLEYKSVDVVVKKRERSLSPMVEERVDEKLSRRERRKIWYEDILHKGNDKENKVKSMVKKKADRQQRRRDFFKPIVDRWRESHGHEMGKIIMSTMEGKKKERKKEKKE